MADEAALTGTAHITFPVDAGKALPGVFGRPIGAEDPSSLTQNPRGLRRTDGKQSGKDRLVIAQL
jgi:hypothetical protein